MRYSARFLLGFLAALSAATAHASDPVTTPWPGFAGSFLVATVAEGNNDWATAEQAYGDLSIRDPYSPELMHRQIVLLVSQGKMEPALAIAQRMDKQQQATHIAQLLLFVDAARRNDAVQAQARLEKISDDGLGQFIKPFFRAWLSGNAKQAEQSFEKAGDLGVLSQMVLLHKALLAEKAGNMEKARGLFAKVVGDRPAYRTLELAAAFYQREQLREQLGALEQAALRNGYDLTWIESLHEPAADREVSSLRDGVAETIYGLATLLQAEGANEAALSYLQIALAIRPELSLAQLARADMLNDLGQRDLATELLGHIEGQGSTARLATLRLATFDAVRAGTGAGEARLRQLLNDRPTWVSGWHQLANILSLGPDSAGAVAAYTKTLDLLGDKGDAALRAQLLGARALQSHRQQDYVATERDLQQAIALQPENAGLLNHLGYLWAERGVRLDEAAGLISRALKQDPNNPSILDSLGWVRFRQGSVDEATRLLELASSVRPYDVTINDHLGDAYWAQGRYREARVQWERAMTYRDNIEPMAVSLEELRNKIAGGLAARQTAASH